MNVQIKRHFNGVTFYPLKCLLTFTSYVGVNFFLLLLDITSLLFKLMTKKLAPLRRARKIVTFFVFVGVALI